MLPPPPPNGTCGDGGVFWGTNLFNYTQYDYQCSFFSKEEHAIPMALGYTIICVIGGLFALVCADVIWLMNLIDRAQGQHADESELLSTAGRDMKTGLTACDVVSKATWAATLLNSSSAAYQYGISGTFWFAAGSVIQILLFSILAVEVKHKCPNIHTVMEMVKARWGTAAHLVFLLFGLLCNLTTTSLLILGGATTMNALSGVDVYVASFLIPLSVVFYTCMGGLKATYVAAWSHVVIVYVGVCIFMFQVFATYPGLGSPSKVWDNITLLWAAGRSNVPGNKEGALLTMFSSGGLQYGVISVVGGFGNIFLDQAYWQSAIAADASASYRGYLLGGLCWFSIPFTFATSLGLAARALDLPISSEEIDQGLVAPAVAVHMMGQGGAFLIALMVFMAVSASGSAEQVAVSSLFTYDIFREYLRPQASSVELCLVLRLGIVGYSMLSGVLASILAIIGVTTGWLFLVMGILLGSGVFPLAAALTWDKCSALAAVSAAVGAQVCGILTWLVVAALQNDGVINLTTTGQNSPMLAGNIVSLLLSVVVCVAISYIAPQNYDFAKLRADTDCLTVRPDPSDLLVRSAPSDLVLRTVPYMATRAAMDPGTVSGKHQQRRAAVWWTSCILSVVFLVAWPALTLPAGIFTKGYWTFWVVLAMGWALISTMLCAVLPVYEARHTWKVMFSVYVLRRPIPNALESAPQAARLTTINNMRHFNTTCVEIALAARLSHSSPRSVRGSTSVDSDLALLQLAPQHSPVQHSGQQSPHPRDHRSFAVYDRPL